MKRKLIALYFTVLILLSAALTSCRKNPADSTGISESERAAITALTPADGKLDFVSEGKPLFTVIKHEGTDNSLGDANAAAKIRKGLAKYCYIQSSTETDALKKGEKYDHESYEILVGPTDYAETAIVAESFTGAGYIVKVIGHKIVVYATTKSSMEKAVDELIALFDKYAVKETRYSLSIDVSLLNFSGTEQREVCTLPLVENAKLFCFYNPGDNCDEAIYDEASRKAFDDYVAKLNELGYKTHTSHNMNDNVFATLYNSEKTVNVGYYDGEKRIRVIIEPFSESSLYGSRESDMLDVRTTAQITMLGVRYTDSDGSNVNNGASLVLRMYDGRFIVIDGGHNRAENMNNIIKVIKDRSSEYLNDGEQPVIAAWFLTHPHGDHIGAIVGQNSLIKAANIKVENVIINLISEEENNKSDSPVNITSCYAAAKSLNANVVVTHVGHTYNYTGITIEMLYTIESLGPAIINDGNQLSLIMKITFTDPNTGEKTVFMANGDGTGAALRNVAENFKAYVACDIGQIAHHGASTKGDDQGTINAYKFMNPKVVLWTSGEGAYTAYKDKSFNKTMLTNKNFKEVLVADECGRQTILSIPYKPGTAKYKSN